MKHYTIPFFVPHMGCQHQCVFCDQRRITGKEGDGIPGPPDIIHKIETYLSTMRSQPARVQVGFFGGSFTGIPAEKQARCLEPVKSYINKGAIDGIRLSTRPDLVDPEKIDFLKSRGVKCVELGVQSMSDKVLAASKRGHTSGDTVMASRMVREMGGFDLVHQIMLGLPGSSSEDELRTAEVSADLGAGQVRIYPVVVMKGTELARMWERGEYTALSMGEAVERAARLMAFFEKRKVRVIRCGLHPTEGLLSGDDHLAGPFHPSFGHLARELSRQKSGTLPCR